MDKPWTGTGVEPCDEAGISHRAGVFAMGCRGGRAGAVDSLLLQTLKFPPQLCTRRKPASGSPAWNEEWTFVMQNSTGTIGADLKHETDGQVRCPPSLSKDEPGPSVIAKASRTSKEGFGDCSARHGSVVRLPSSASIKGGKPTSFDLGRIQTYIDVLILDGFKLAWESKVQTQALKSFCWGAGGIRGRCGGSHVRV